MADGTDLDLTPAPKSTAGIRTGHTMALVPRTFDDAWRIAQAFARSGMCPKGMDQAEQVLVAVMAGAEIGLAPFQSVQSFAVINGRPSLWGDGMLAVVRQFGVQVSERLEGDGEAATAHCKVTRPSGEIIERSFSVADAKAAKLWGKTGRSGEPTPWVTYPKRMLQMRARAWALRDGCADMLRGLHMAEEAQDMEVISNEPIAESNGRVVEKVLNEATGKMIDPYCANQLRKPGGKWEIMADRIKGFEEAGDAEGLKAWSTSAEITEDLAKWPRTWREAMEQEMDQAFARIEKAG